LYLGTDGNGSTTPTNLVYGLELGNVTTFNSIDKLQGATTYYWKVIPYNNTGVAIGSSIWSFTTELPPVPDVAYTPSPADLALGVMITAELSWSPAPAGAEPTGYKLYIGTNNPPTNIANGFDLGNATTYSSIGLLLHNTTYYWKVTAYSTNGDSNASTIWSFTTEKEPTLTLTPPAKLNISLQDGNILLSWDAVSNATSYKIYSSTDPIASDWGLPIGNTGLTEFTDLTLGSCFYRVIATSELPTRSASPAFLPAKVISSDPSGN
jgi:hypothetical protein